MRMHAASLLCAQHSHRSVQHISSGFPASSRRFMPKQTAGRANGPDAPMAPMDCPAISLIHVKEQDGS